MRSLPRPYPLYLLGSLLICLCTLYTHAQQQYLFSHLSTKDGLASNITTAIEQDAKGFIWLGTVGGVQRYDGQRFMIFRHRDNDSTSIPNDVVMAIRLDKSHRLWVLCQYNKIGYIDLDELRYHPVSVDLPAADQARMEGNIHIDYEGHILLFFAHNAPLAFDESIRSFTKAALPFEMPAGWPTLNILEDSVTHTYYLGGDSGLVKYNQRQHTMSYRGHNADHDPVISRYGHLTYIYPALLDRSGTFWITTWPPAGAFTFYSFQPQTGKTDTWQNQLSKSLHHQYFELTIAHDQGNGIIWLAGRNALLTLRKSTGEIENMKTSTANEFGIYFDIINSLMQDREGNVWLATDKGLYRFNPSEQRFRTIINRRPGKDSAYTPDVTDILQISNGDIVVSTWGSGLFAYDSAFHPIDRWYVKAPGRFYQSGTWCIHQRSNGDIWTGEQAGSVVVAHAATHTFELLRPPALENSTVRQIAEDRYGNLWLGTQRGKLIKWNAAANSFSIAHDLHSRVYRLYKDWKGDIWACTMQHGIYHIDPSDGAILHNYTAEGPGNKKLPDITAFDITQFSDSVYAIASNTLCFLNIHTGEITMAEHADGIPFEGINNVVKDKFGQLWVTTRDGLCKTNTHNQIRNVFREEDGISTNAFDEASSAVLADGRIALGTSHDIIVFQPASVSGGALTPPNVEITNIALSNKWLPMDSVSRLSELELPYGDNGLRIAFSTLSYFSSFGVSYKMENLDKDWITGQYSDAVYNYLPPGHYVFRVHARNSDDKVSPRISELHITVRSPFWRTWWFLGFLLLAAAAVLYLLDRLRMQRKAELENIRSNISGGLHEEVNKALQNINVLSEIARIKADKEPLQSINYINEIHAQSHNMIIAMDDMLWSIDPANDSMDRAIDRMKEFAGALSRRHGARIGLEADESIRSLKPDMNIRHEFLLIYKLALRLLVEEMHVSGVLVQLDYQRPHFHLTMFAAGARMDERNSRGIRLLEEMKTRARGIHGTLEMQYDEKGTAILFICPSTF